MTHTNQPYHAIGVATCQTLTSHRQEGTWCVDKRTFGRVQYRMQHHASYSLKAYAAHLKEIESQHLDRTVGQVRVVRETAIVRQ